MINNSVISHRDLDRKNLLWDEDHVPIIIDWEAAGTTDDIEQVLGTWGSTWVVGY